MTCIWKGRFKVEVSIDKETIVCFDCCICSNNLLQQSLHVEGDDIPYDRIMQGECLFDITLLQNEILIMNVLSAICR